MTRVSHNRELKNAQAAVIEEVEAALAAGADVPQRIADAFEVLHRLQYQLDEEGASSGRDTSVTAAVLGLPMKGSLRLRVIKLVTAHYAQWRTGMTVAEAEARTGRSHQSVSSAFNYAVEHAWLRDSGHRRDTGLGRPAIVWEPTERARRELQAEALAG